MQLRNSLVSIGVPTYNRPEGLRRTLECLSRQTYPTIEIIISDNATPGNEPEKVAMEFMAIDPRIRFFRQPVNGGPIKNIKFVLEQSRGEFFMWAADDDKWEAFFIDRCVKEFAQNNGNLAAVTMEAKYFDDNRLFDFFPEGRPFYGNTPDSVIKRLSHMLRHNYGNLFYSLFRRSVLFRDQQSLFDCVSFRSLNEIGLFLFIVEQGGWKVIPEIGFYKKSQAGTIQQAKWQIEGGKQASLLRAGLIPVLSMLKYHYDAFKDIRTAIRSFRMPNIQKFKLHMESAMRIALAYLYLILGTK